MARGIVKKTKRPSKPAKIVSEKDGRLIKAVKSLTNKEVAEIAAMLLTNDVVELERISEDSTSSNVLQVWYARVALRGIRLGDVFALNQVLDRVIGKAKEKIELTGKDGSPIALTAVPDMSQEERIIEIERLRALRKAAGND